MDLSILGRKERELWEAVKREPHRKLKDIARELKTHPSYYSKAKGKLRDRGLLEMVKGMPHLERKPYTLKNKTKRSSFETILVPPKESKKLTIIIGDVDQVLEVIRGMS